MVNGSTPGTDTTPIAIVVPGLTSDSTAAVNFTTLFYILLLFIYLSFGTVSCISCFRLFTTRVFSILQYIKNLAFWLAKEGWNVVVQNHRGLGGISLTVSFFVFYFLVLDFSFIFLYHRCVMYFD